MKSVSVFCGSSFGNQPEFVNQAKILGKELALRGTTLIYGGANVGLMGAVADAVLENGGTVIGVLPRFLESKEVAHRGLSQLILCETMHERKTKMFEMSEGFIAMPGGFGTLEEVIEILTWQQLGLHRFPVGFLNVNGFYNHLSELFDHMEASQFLRPQNKSMALFGNSVMALLEKMISYKGVVTPELIKKSTT